MFKTSGLSAFMELTGWPAGEITDVFETEKKLADSYPIREVSLSSISAGTWHWQAKTDVAVTEYSKAQGITSFIVIPSCVCKYPKAKISIFQKTHSDYRWQRNRWMESTIGSASRHRGSLCIWKEGLQVSYQLGDQLYIPILVLLLLTRLAEHHRCSHFRPHRFVQANRWEGRPERAHPKE